MTAPAPRTDAAKVRASTGFGVDDYSDYFVPESVAAELERDLAAHREALRVAEKALKPLAAESEKIHTGFDRDKYASWFVFVSDLRKAHAALARIQSLTKEETK